MFDEESICIPHSGYPYTGRMAERVRGADGAQRLGWFKWEYRERRGRYAAEFHVRRVGLVGHRLCSGHGAEAWREKGNVNVRRMSIGARSVSA